jgi:3-oxoacyl-[acyl-carrier-protein] synthase-3
VTYASISGTGSYLPERVMENAEFADRLGLETSDAWIRERTGIRRRHIAGERETTSDMALVAGQRALEAGGIEAADLDLVLIATTTPDKVFPSTACILHRRLGLKSVPAFDVHAACSGFVYGLDVARRYIETGAARNVLLIGAETYSRILDWTDRSTCVLFGDGAGAVVMTASDEQGLISSHIHADGEYEELLHVPAGISSGYDLVQAQAAFINMRGHEVFKRAVGQLGAIARETLQANGITGDEVDWLIPHQANLRIISAAAKKLGMPMDRVVVTVDEHANTSSASIPLALDVAVRDGRVRRGNLLLFEAFGAGFTWGSALLRY